MLTGTVAGSIGAQDALNLYEKLENIISSSILFIMHPLIHFSSFSRQGDSQEWYSPLLASQSSNSPLLTTPQIFRHIRTVRFVFNSSTKIPYPRVSSHQVRNFRSKSIIQAVELRYGNLRSEAHRHNFPILSRLCQWRSDRCLFLYPVADSVRRVTRSLLPNMTTRINDGASVCAVMRLDLAWITKWP